MSEVRLLPSDIETLKLAGDNLQQSSQGGLKYSGSKIEKLCNEIEASWAEIEQLRAIALAAAEEMANSPATDSPLFDAVREWQKRQREKA